MKTPKPTLKEKERRAERAIDADRLPLQPLVEMPGREPTSSPVPERRILAVMGEVRRLGRWSVPSLFRVRAFLGEVKIDLRNNIIPPDFTLDVRAFGSRVTLIVPPGLDVSFDVVVLIGNGINQANEPIAERSTTPRIHVKGSAVLGEIRVLVREGDG